MMKRKNVTFGSALRQLRRSDPRNLTLKDVADAGGISIPYLSDIERDARLPPGNEVIELILKFLNQEGELQRMIQLAATSRPTVEISLKQKSEEARAALVTLARRSDDIPEEIWQKILRLVKPKEK